MNFIKTFLAGLLAVVFGSFLFLFVGIMVLVALAGSMDSPVVVKSDSILKIDLAEIITDSPSTDPLAGIDFATMSSTRSINLFKALRAIEAAKSDDRIRGIYLRMNGHGGVAGTALLEELRAALVDFKTGGKFIISYDETYTQGKYFLASVADKIYLQPEGMVDWSGLSMDVMFYKGLFDKLDLKAEVFRPTTCKYKSAVEPYILDRMSPENRAQMQQLVSSMWSTISGSVAHARGIDSTVMAKLTDNLEVILPEEALQHRFVDSLLYEDQIAQLFTDRGVKPDSKGKHNFVTFGQYTAQVSADLKNISADQIAIIYADGAIVDGEGSGKEVYGNSLAKTIAAVRGDEKVKSVVLRVNSPGGSALASDVIWREVELLRAEKPVVVSMGSYAASGGYYIAAPADVIVANRTTLTGSIGVFGLYINTFDAMKNKLGITVDGVKSSAQAGAGTSGPITPIQRASIMRGVDKVYTTFTELVAKGRNLPLENVLDIAGGRVWTGSDALSIGLIDTYGGLKEAIAIAADKANLGENYRVVERIEAPTGFAAVLASLNMNIRASFTRSELQLLMEQYKRVQEATQQQGVLMYTPLKFDLR